jgi:hypothetical protein
MNTHKSFAFRYNDSTRVTAPKYALIATLRIMQFYSMLGKKTKVSDQLNQPYVQGYDRESVCFMLLGGDSDRPVPYSRRHSPALLPARLLGRLLIIRACV